MRTLLGFLLVTVSIVLLPSCMEERTAFPTPMASPPTWRGITPGVTTEQQVVILLGQPARKEQVSEFTCFVYPSEIGVNAWPHKVYLANGIVYRIKENVPISREKYISLSVFIERYGDPQKVTWAALWPQTRTFVFPEHGISVVADHVGEPPERYRVWQIDYFVPMSLESYMRIWGKFLPKENPDPRHDPYPEDFYHTPWVTVTPNPQQATPIITRAAPTKQSQ